MIPVTPNVTSMSLTRVLWITAAIMTITAMQIVQKEKENKSKNKKNKRTLTT